MFQMMAPWTPSFCSALSTELESKPFLEFTFCNVGKNGMPHARVVAYRGFLFDDKQTNVIIFGTDKRSAKYKDLCHNPRFEACFYFEKLRIQLRLSGFVKIIGEDLHPNLTFNIPTNLSNNIPNTNNNENNDNDNDNDNYNDDNDNDKYKDNDNDTTTNDSNLSNDNNQIGETVFHDDEILLQSRSNSSHRSDSSNSSSSFDYETPVPELEDFYHITENVRIEDPLTYKILSPNYLKTVNSSYSTLNELNHSNHIDSVPPTEEEWKDERKRVWNLLSRSTKNSFKKPQPGTLINEFKSKKIDSIKRGVDGTSSGFENFVVVCLFVNSVDQLDLTTMRRLMMKRDDIDTWKEFEVCP